MIHRKPQRKKLSAAESTEERQTRQEKDRVRHMQSFLCETEEERALRQEKHRASNARARLCETVEEKALRQEKDRLRHATARLCETVEERALRQQQDSVRHTTARYCETAEEKEGRLQTLPACAAISRRAAHTDLNLSAFHYNANYDYSLHLSIIIAKMDKVCNFCSALKFRNETPGMCCPGGKVKLQELNPPPEPLLTLLSGSTTQSKLFLKIQFKIQFENTIHVFK